MSPAISAKEWVGAVRAVGVAGAAVAQAATKPERRAAEVRLADAQRAEGEAWARLEASRLGYLAQCVPLGPGPELPDALPEAAAEEESVAAEVE